MADSLDPISEEHRALRAELSALSRLRDRLDGSPETSADYRAYRDRLQAFHARLERHLAHLESKVSKL